MSTVILPVHKRFAQSATSLRQICRPAPLHAGTVAMSSQSLFRARCFRQSVLPQLCADCVFRRDQVRWSCLARGHFVDQCRGSKPQLQRP